MAIELPTEYTAGRFYLVPETRDGIRLRLYTDTGGGDFLWQSAATLLGLETYSVTGANEAAVVDMPEFKPEAWIPSISVNDDPRSSEFRGRLLVNADKPGKDSDGTLGQAWFGGRIWTFDYPGQRMLLEEDGKTISSGSAVPVGFPLNPDGRRGTNFPSIEATVEGDTFAFLFDTGATAYLTEEARSKLGGPPKHATCFVTAHVFDRWRDRYPKCRFLESGDRNADGQPMIEVPSVTIAGLDSGPVWFTRRPDSNFHEWMSSMMDRKVEGALGGSLLQYFRVTLDYPRAVASFTSG